MAPAGTPFGGLSSWLWPFLRGVGIFVRDRLAGLVSLLCFRCPGRPKGRFLGTTKELRRPVARSIVAPFRQVFLKNPAVRPVAIPYVPGCASPANTGLYLRTRTPSLLLAGPVPTTPPGSPRVKGSPKAPAPPRRQRRPVYPKAEREKCGTGFGGGDEAGGKGLILLGGVLCALLSECPMAPNHRAYCRWLPPAVIADSGALVIDSHMRSSCRSKIGIFGSLMIFIALICDS